MNDRASHPGGDLAYLIRQMKAPRIPQARANVSFRGPPGTGKTHLAVALGMKACVAGHRVQFATATQWVMRLAAANHEKRLEAYLRQLERTPLILIDEVGYIPFDAEAANLL